MGTLVWLLDPAFGFFLWAAHFLVIYIAAAVACVLGLGAASADAQSAFLTGLGLVTAASAVILVLHAVWRYRQQRDVPAQRFRMSFTIGCDAIASFAVLLQFFPILLVPVCA
ncbi:hypothetical protein [Microvirga sp. M2]|uniref:hypothetical protein n=1 Tax=Microvirga sp. M2 TaxID=3073270 RepID=UPI0039C3588C